MIANGRRRCRIGDALPVGVSRFDGAGRPPGSPFGRMRRPVSRTGSATARRTLTEGDGEAVGCTPRSLAISSWACVVASCAAAISRLVRGEVPRAERRVGRDEVLRRLVEERLDLLLDGALRRLLPRPPGGTTSPSESVSAARSELPIPICVPLTTTTRLSSGIAFGWLDCT